MFSGGIPVTSRAKERKTKIQRRARSVVIFATLLMVGFLSALVFRSFAEIITDNDVRVDVDSELTYYLNVKEDGVDAAGIESSDSQIAEVRGGRINVTDRIPDGLVFQGFVTTSDGTFGAVSRSDSSIQCLGKVIDDTNEATLDTGTWNNTHTEYYYHGLHYNDTTRTVSFTAEKIKAGCQLTIGIITKTPATIDDPDTTPVEARRDFYNTAFAAEKDITAISNTVHAWIGDSNMRLYKVRYVYTGDIPTGAPTTPTEQSYPANNEVTVSMNPTLEGYTFSGWTTSGATVIDGSFTMPDQDVELVGIWTKNTAATKYNVTYVINGDKPADFMPPTQKEYEAGVSVPLDSTEANAVIDGYRFSGWTTTDVDISETGFTMPERNVTIVGSFERISYRVCYEFEGAILPPNSTSILPPCETHYPGETVTRAADPQADGYDFLGWYKNATFIMPEENVTIYGEWMRTMGKFAPTIAKTIIDPKDKYMYGETVKFKITVTNPESFAITDVYLQEELDGAVFTAPNDSSYTVKTSTIAVIPIVNANSSIDVYAEYRVTENTAQTLTNIVELTGALAEDHILDTDQEYKATVDFDTIPEPVPLTGIIFNALPYAGMIVLGIGILVCLVLLPRRLKVNTRAIRYASGTAFKYALPGIIAATFVFGGLMIHSAMAAPYTEVVKSVTLTSQHASYTNNTPGSWNVEKSAEWIEAGKARITFNVDTVAKIADNAHLDLVMVIDNSGSMSGEKIAQVKHDATELIESVLSDNNNRIGLVSFNTNATKLSDFTSDSATLVSLMNNLDTSDCTNYYDGFKKAEEVLESYQKQNNRELIMLFLTDGYPNGQTPNEIPEYQALKAMYPYMTINGIQYEMGDEVLNPIRAVTDNQFIANMDSLNNVLFEASITPYVYNNFTLVDYINDEYWDVDSVDSIEASIGETALTHNGNTPVVTWTMNNLLRSGKTAQLTIDVTLKNAGAILENTFLPTNDHETIQSSLPETPNESIESELTPVLKSSYKVTYEPNLPSACSAYEGTLPAEQNYLPMTIVAKSSNTISCNGYNFDGWEIAEGDPKVLNDDYFKIADDDVILRATWTKPSISKSMDGEVKEEVFATLDTGTNVNVALKKLSGQSNPIYSTTNKTIKAIKTATSMSAAQQSNAAIISTTNSAVPIYAWFDDTDGSIYVYSEADIIQGNSNMGYMFRGASRLTDISGAANWNTSSVTDMNSMFRDASSLTNIDVLAEWDTSSVTNMSLMFSSASSLTSIDALTNWDTSSVANMSYMFQNASSLTNISGAASWDTSSVTDMNSMFRGASNLTNIDALAGWDTFKVTNMSNMFYGASSLTGIDVLANWGTSKVTSMNAMFRGASSLTDISGAANWDTSSVMDMGYMFSGASRLTNIDVLANWNTSKVTSMSDMFDGASSLANIDGASGWDTSKVTDMHYMFSGASNLTNIDALAEWDTSSVTNMSYMFENASSLANIDGASGWDTSRVADMGYMFRGASSLANIDGASGWDTSKVANMHHMFGASSLTNIDALAEWDTSSATDMAYMFQNASSLANIDGASGWDTSKVTNMSYMFRGASSLANIDGASGWDTSKVTNMTYMFYGASSFANIDALASWDTSSVMNMSDMFQYASSLTNIDALASWDTSSVTNMSYMFFGASSLANIDGASGWDTSNVTNMNSMFYGARNLTNIDGASGWDTSSVTNMSYMFENASSLTNIDALANWNTSKVTSMIYMFYDASSLANIDALAGWDTSNVTNMNSMFRGASSLANIDGASGWDTSNVTSMYQMFSGASGLTNIDGASDWDTSKVTNMSYMFQYDSQITSLQPIFNWTVQSTANMSGMFNNVPASVTRPGWYTGG